MTPDTAIIEPDNWLDPLPIADLYPCEQPLEVDIGCGKGRFLAAHAAGHRGINFLGIDRRLTRLRKVDKKLRRLELTNVRLLPLEAAYSIRYLLPAQSVNSFYIFFPDPWPKRRHHRRRLIGPTFLPVLASRLRRGGLAHFATDHLDYFTAGHALLTGSPLFEEVETFLPSEAEQTDFERIFLAQDKPIGRCSFVRTSAAASNGDPA